MRISEANQENFEGRVLFLAKYTLILYERVTKLVFRYNAAKCSSR